MPVEAGSIHISCFLEETCFIAGEVKRDQARKQGRGHEGYAEHASLCVRISRLRGRLRESKRGGQQVCQRCQRTG